MSFSEQLSPGRLYLYIDDESRDFTVSYFGGTSIEVVCNLSQFNLTTGNHTLFMEYVPTNAPQSSIFSNSVSVYYEAKTYNVSISDSIANGSVTADKEKAVEGEQVKLTVEPDDGYLLDSLSVSGGITPVQNGEFTYVFNMPADDVTVTATFKTEIPTITLSSNREVCSYKDSPTLTMSFSEQLSPGRLYLYIDDESRDFTVSYFGGTSIEVVCNLSQFNLTTGNHTLFMEYVPTNAPQSSIFSNSVSVYYEAKTYNVSISDSIANGSVTADKEKAVEGEQVKLTVEPDDGYLLNTLSVSGGITPVQNGEFTYVFNMPADDVTVTATFVECDHSENTNSGRDKGDGTHSISCSVCSVEFTEAHDYDESGKCMVCDYQAVVSLTKGEGEAEYYTTLGAAVTAAGSCTAADEAVLTLLADIDQGEDYQTIASGVFTLDLNGFELSNNAEDSAITLYSSNSSIVLTITDSSNEKSGLISGNYNAIFSINSTVNILGGSFSAAYDAVDAYNSTVNISGGSFDGSRVDILNNDGSSTITLSLPEDGGDGATFPSGISVAYTTLNAILGEGAAYWQGDKMILPADDATEISSGDVTIKKACDHSENTNSGTDNGDGTHSISCSECSVEFVTNEAHSFSFSAEQHVLSVSCEKCDMETAEISLVEPAELLYDGSAKIAAASGSVPGLTLAAVEYCCEDGCINAGEHTVSLTMGEATAELSFEIMAAEPTLSWAEASESLTYTGSPAAITAPVVTLVNNESYSGQINYSYSAAGETEEKAGLPTEVGEYSVKASIPAAGNYTAAESNDRLSLTITAKAIEAVNISVSGLEESYDYTGQPIQPEVSVSVEGNAISDADYEVSYGENTTVADGGTVTVTLKHNYSGEQSFRFAINPISQADFRVVGPLSATYEDEPIQLSTEGGSGEGSISWEIISGSEYASIDANGLLTILGAGSVTVQATKATDGNYLAASDSHSIRIAKAPVSEADFTYTAPTDLVYSRSAKVATVSGKEGFGEITVKYYSNAELTEEAEPLLVGTYYVGILMAESANYEGITVPMAMGSFEITPKPLNVAADEQSRKYGEENPELSYSAPELIDGDSLEGALFTEATKDSDVGEYEISQGTLSHSEYEISFTGATLTIVQADGPIAPTVTGSYLDDGMSYTFTVDAIEDAEYSLDGESWQESNVFEKLTAGQTYTFYARIKENKNFTAGQIGSSAGIDLEKLPGKGSVTMDNWTYGEEAASPATESSTGNPVEGYLYESTDGQGYSSDAVPTNAGDYKVTVSFGETTTHNGTKASAEFSIAKAIPQVETPSGISAIYGDTLADVLLPEGWSWEAEDSTPVGNVEDENEFTLIFTHPTDPINYEQLRESVQITVNPKEVTAPSIQLAEGSFVYNGSAHRPLVTVKDGENIVPGSEYTVEYQNNVNAGTATVLVKDNAGGNYTISGQSSFRIVKAACSTPAALEREFLRTIATYGNVINLEQLLPQDHGTVSYSIGKGNSAILANVSVDANGKLSFDTRTAEAPSSSEITVDVVMENYEDITLTVLVSLTGKETPQIIGVSAAEGLRYSGKAQKGYIGAPRSEYTGNYEIFYSGRGNSYSSVLAPTKAGDYTVTFKIPESDLYYAGSLSLNFSIGKAPLKVVADDKEAQRWAEMPELSCKVLGLIGDDTVSVTLKCDADMDQAGEYPILVSAVDASGNYEIEAVEGTLTVSTRPYRPDVDDKDDDEDKDEDKKPGNPGYIGTKECDGGLLCPLYPFQDVDRNAWYHDGLHYVVEEGLMQGMSSTSFAPNTATSRAMIVTILWRLEGSPMVDSAMRFEDVAAGAWYTEAIRWAAATGIVTGYSEKAFGPNDSITREQMAAILYRYAQYKGYALSGSSIQSYTDAANVSSWAKDAMEWACGSGLIQGSSNLLDPQGDAIRAQSATILHRFCEMLDK